MKRRFTYAFTYEDNHYTVTVPDVPGAITQCAYRYQIEPRIREAIALVLDVEPGSFDLVEPS